MINTVSINEEIKDKTNEFTLYKNCIFNQYKLAKNADGKFLSKEQVYQINE